ncbi:xanthine dehydrogenase family protein molybdopterin-binding subunit [Pelomicrobium sp.]|jgi:isoquinoline 1-oxidoreductase beta subunit|uniref:xanthine dehydrogenase family protein molybdopterin-binding subunit n=1 Tax=Pelomicrobium sp. TaxID=2815319 RepID=UPI002FDE0A06
MSEPQSLERRVFLKGSAALAGSLIIGFHLPTRGARAAQSADAATGGTFAPNAFLRIAPDNTVTVIVKHLEMGQGVYTGLPTLLAEELEVDWKQVRVEAAPADVARYANLAWGGAAQGTGGSTSLANSWEQLRRAGAMARQMLITAAAQTWNVGAGGLKAEKGFVIDPQSGRRLSYGELTAKAASLPPPTDVKLKTPSQWRLIGRSVPRKDSPEKVNGAAVFAVDVKLPGMLTAVVARPPRFGGRVKRFDAQKAKAMPGVKAVVEIPQGVAVVATDFWSALQARNALVIEWDETRAFTGGSEELFRRYAELAQQPGTVARKEGNAEAALDSAARRLGATFEFPFLAHAPMEPLSSVVRLTDEVCEVWAGSQLQTLDQAVAARIAGLPPERVRIHTLLAGGSFGRHANPTADYIAEGVAVAAATRALGAPIRLMWTREDDIRGGYYRPLYVHRITAGLDTAGRPVAWLQRIVGQSILKGTPFEGMMKDGIDPTSVEGATNLPYTIPHLQVELHTVDIGVPVLWWRSVGSTHTAFSTEVMMDMLAHAAGQDPVAFRLELLAKHPRHAGVLKLAAEKAGWGRALPRNRGQGVAVHESFHSFVAQVAEVTVRDEGTFSVDRVVCAVDCGVAVNPDVVRAQMESGIVFGLSAALYGAITLKDGTVVQSNFSDYPVLRLDETPKIEVHIVKSEAPPTGVGEPGVPPIAPAVANALFAATGKWLTKLPLRLKER